MSEPLHALLRRGEVLFELDRSLHPGMRVPARVVADDVLIEQIGRDRSLEQLANVATLPGLVDAVVGMPDMHEGYGFPVGGVAATRVSDGVISPGGIGFDINCGVRLLTSALSAAEVEPRLDALMDSLSRSVPAGFGRHGRLELDPETLDHVLAEGCPYLVRSQKLGIEEDLQRLESGGALSGANPAAVSSRAKLRGSDQLGTLGGGNHFLEVQRVDAVFDASAARAFGLFEGQLTVLIHTGSRGLGHQVCTDYVRQMDESMLRHGIHVPDRQLACAPFASHEGRSYFGAMAAAANFAWCNRQVLTERVRDQFLRILGPAARLSVVYDVAHNIAKLEEHRGEKVCVHRKGATRAFGPSSPELPPGLRGVGQPVFIPGSMGTASFVLVGGEGAAEISLRSCCHGAGRALSRAAAKRQVHGDVLRRALQQEGVRIRCASNAELAEEAPLAYKDVERVVEVVQRAGIARKVVRLRPLGVVKG